MLQNNAKLAGLYANTVSGLLRMFAKHS